MICIVKTGTAANAAAPVFRAVLRNCFKAFLGGLPAAADPGNPVAPWKADPGNPSAPGKADPGNADPGNPAAPGNLVVFEPRRHRRRVLKGEFAFCGEGAFVRFFSANIHCRVPEQDSVTALRHVDKEEIMQGFGIVFLTALIFCACGFYMYIYFFSLGYGFSIAAIGAVLLFMFRGTVSAGTAAQCLLFIIYGLRLGGYLLIRDLRSSSYRKVLDPELKRSRAMGIVPKLSIWISCALLYTLQTSPVLFRLQNGDGTNPALTAGAVIMFLGVVIETLADYQKSQAKKIRPYRFVDTGLYRIVRCPNYFGEILLWTGVLISGIGSLHGIVQWACAVAGFLLIIYVMFSGARRLELRQDKSYGKDPEYQKYITTVPIILPFIPLYSVKKYKFLVA